MKRIKTKMDVLTREMETLIEEQGHIRNRSKEIEIRMHQVMGGLQALQEVIQEESIGQATKAVSVLVEDLNSRS